MNAQHGADDALAEFLPRSLRFALWCVGSVVVALIVIPTAYLILWSFCGTEIIGRLVPLRDASFKWYQEVLEAAEWRDAIAASTEIALVVSVFGACVAAGYDYSKRFSNRLLQLTTWGAMVLLLTNPLIAYGMSLRAAGAAIEINPWLVIALGHLAIIAPLQFLVFEAASRFIDTDMLNASRTLGASHWRTFYSVYLPNAIRPVVASMVIGAFVSFDELVIALFTLEGPTATVPLQIWRSISHVVEPRPAVVASLAVTAAAVSWFAYEQLNPKNARTVRGLWERASGMRKEAMGAVAGLAAVHYALPDGHGPWHALLQIVLHATGAVTGGVLVGLWKLRSILRGLLVTVNAEPHGTRKVARGFVLPGVSEDVDSLEGLLGGGLVSINRAQCCRLTAACFHEFRGGQYIGTDRNVPSRYYELYPDYLETQLRGRSRKGDIRIVMYSHTALLDDLASHPEEGTRFLEMHWGTGVTLLCVDWSVAEGAAHRFELETPDAGIFAREVALFFLPSSRDDSSRMMLRVVDDALRRRLQLFLDELIDNAMEVVRGTSWLVAFRALADDERSSLKGACSLEV